MKYFVTLISIILLMAAVWVVFFSGIILHKKTNPMPTQDTTESQPAESKPVETALTDAEKKQNVVLETSLGTIKIALDYSAAPQTSANFAKLAKQGFYNSLTFHRVIDGFMIQGGDPLGTGTGGPGYTVPAEIGLPHKHGSIATARQGDEFNPKRESSGSQFFIVLTGAAEQTLAELDQGGYTVFGQVASGMDVVDKIGKVKTGAGDKPLTPVIIKKAYLE